MQQTDTEFVGVSFYRLRATARIIALITSDTPISITIPAQKTNHVCILVDSTRSIRIRKPVPNQKTKFDIVSAFLPHGERAKNLSAKTTIWKSPMAKLNFSAAE